jgi:DNA-binding NtrC family response regulator
MNRAAGAVLVVDDDLNCSESIRTVLERDGYCVESTNHVDTAMEALRNRQFDLVFCDYRMPDKTGIDLLREVQHERLRVPIVMITADADVDIADRARELGVADLITKPVRRRALLEVAAKNRLL